jgi:hypothetical protein
MQPSYLLRRLEVPDSGQFRHKRVTAIGDWGKLCKEDQAMVSRPDRGIPAT